MLMPSLDVVSFWTGIVLGVPSLGLSIVAWRKAASAERTAARLVGRINLQEDGERARDVLIALNKGKEAALRRQRGAPASYSAGRAIEDDMQAVREAHDALSTRLPLELAPADRNAIRAKAEELQVALDTVASGNTNRDGWKDALAALQSVIYRLDFVERLARNQIVLPPEQ